MMVDSSARPDRAAARSRPTVARPWWSMAFESFAALRRVHVRVPLVVVLLGVILGLTIVVAAGLDRGIADDPLQWSALQIGLVGLLVPVAAWVGGEMVARRRVKAGLAVLFAEQAATAIETARLNARLEEQLGRLRTLGRLHQLIFSTLDRGAVLDELARAAAELMAVPLAGIWMVDRAEGVVRAGAVAGPSVAAGVPWPEIPIGMSVVGLVAATGEAIEIDNVDADDRLLSLEWLRRHDLRSLIAIPALDDDRHACAVLVLNGHAPLRLTAADRDLLESFVAMAATAIRNASLYEGEAQARQAAELANRSRSAQLSRMSHELRTPLNAILGCAQVLELSPLDASDADCVQDILQAGKRLLELIDDVLDVARVDAGRLALALESVEVSDAVLDVVDEVHPLAAERSIAIKVAGALDTALLADRERLHQILLGLLTNAVKYNQPGGRVSVTCEELSPSLLRILVADTGPGIDPDRLARLFDPFDRLDAERTGVPGTGLGLTIAKALAEAMGGTLGASSEVGSGSTFWVDLPRPPGTTLLAAGSLDGADVAAAGSPRQHVVLYVADDRQDTTLARRALAWRPDVTLLSATRTADGLALARDHTPALIVTDLQLPDLSGAELLARLRADEHTARIPVIVVGAGADEAEAARLLDDGARACLPRPLDVRAFLGVVDEILRIAS